MDSFLLRDYRPECRYGAGCYQKNPEHKAKFKHPEKDEKKKVEQKESGIDKENEATANKDVSPNPDKKRQLSSDSDIEENKKHKLHEISDDSQDEPNTVTEDEVDINQEAEEKEEKKISESSTEQSFDDILPDSPTNIQESIKSKFLVSMPEDFYNFYKFCKSVNNSSPTQALNSVGLKLCGPYDVLAGNIPAAAPRSAKLFLTHGRYYYDPPELCTVLCEPHYKTGLHVGYFRDSPDDEPVFLASGVEVDGAKLTILGDNIFSAVYHHLSSHIEKVDPFMRSKMATMMEKIKLWVNKAMMVGNDTLNLEKRTAGMKNRDRAKMASTFHGAGMVVPYDRKTEVGYREIPETPASLRKIIRNVVEAETEKEQDLAFDVLQELVTNVQFANDEGDPGMGLELGLDLLCFGGERLHNTIKHLMCVAYDLLDRDQFGKILTCHLERRMKGEQDSFSRWREETNK
eukprot:GFUD01018194.1.p1 GENE.GFUD01018194.1~~GFUD01018194.1.p1  ORF type:complete len:460 (+),score=173.33 GFUD01018194.1:74-1453(+)